MDHDALALSAVLLRCIDGRIEAPNSVAGIALYANYGTHLVWQSSWKAKGKLSIPSSSVRSRDERFNLLDGDKHMTRVLAATLVGVLALVCSPLAQTGGGRLRISWIDVEGGASTLFAAPNGQSLLFDTGFPGNDDRDAKRIAVTSQGDGGRGSTRGHQHWHGDHAGGLPRSPKLLPLGTFYDHGDGVEESDPPLYGLQPSPGRTDAIVKPGTRSRSATCACACSSLRARHRRRRQRRHSQPVVR